MVNPLEALRDYLHEIGAEDTSIKPSPGARQRLPIYLGNRYNVYDARFFGQWYCLLHDRKGIRPTPAEGAKHVARVQSLLGKPVALLLEALPSFERKRLIEKRVAFIVPHHQVYLPMALIDLRKLSGPATDEQSRDLSPLSAPAQVLVLFHIQNRDATHWSLTQWGERLRYSPSSLTRVRRSLESTDLCRTRSEGRARFLEFLHDRRTLWSTALPRLQSPVRKRVHGRLVVANRAQLFRAGFTALAYRSMLAAGDVPVYAMLSSELQSAMKDGNLAQQPEGEPDSVVLEGWRYPPAVLSPDGVHVDNLSLYLSLRESPDARVQSALEEMLESMPW